MRAIAWAVVVFFLVAAGRASAFADPPTTVRLVYIRAAGAERCPDEAAVRAGVAARLGRDPFRADADKIVHAILAGTAGGMAGKIEVRDLAGASLGAREISVGETDCAELVAAVELAIAIAVDPLAIGRPGPLASPSVPSPSLSPSPSPSLVIRTSGSTLVVRVSRPPASSAGPPLRVRAGAGTQLAFGSAPSAAVGVALGVELRRGARSFAVEGRADLPAERPVERGTISGSVVAASAVPCVHPGAFAACGLVSVGAFRGAGHGLEDSRQVTTPYVALGGRVARDVPLGSLVGTFHLDLALPLSRTRLTVDGNEVWSSPPVSAVLGLRLAGHIL